jgi:hypothetical protein
MGYTVEKIESVAEKFRNLPPAPENKKREVSKQEIVKMLANEISGLQERGYTIEQIAELMRGEGLDFATPVLRSYLQRTKQKRRTKKAKGNKAKLVESSKTNTDTPPAAPPLAGASSTSKLHQQVDQSKARFTVKPDTKDI